MLHGMSKLQWSHILPFQWLLDLVLMLDSIHNIFEITLNLCRLCSWRQRRFFQASTVHEDPCRINPVMGKAWAVESWKPSSLRHGLLCRCCVNCCKSYIPAHQSPKNEESTALFQFTPVYHCSSLLFQVTVQGVPVLREDEGATSTQLLLSRCWGAVWAMFALVSPPLRAADSAVVSTSVRQPQITRYSLSAGGWSTTQADLPCFTLVLICSQPKTTHPLQCNQQNDSLRQLHLFTLSKKRITCIKASTFCFTTSPHRFGCLLRQGEDIVQP